MVYNNIPVFAVNVDDPGCSISAMSLVDDPAMSIDMVCFSKEQNMKFSIQDETQHNILTCLVRVDFPILRVTPDGNPYYIVFNKDTAKVLCQRLMKDGMQQNISLNHNGKLIQDIKLQEEFIKDTEKGISIESLIGIEEFKKKCNKKTKKNNMSKIKEVLKRLLMEFNTLSTDKAELYWEEDTELMVGYKVFVEDESGNKVPAMDGEYISDENKIKVAGGVVTEIERREVDDMPVNVPAEKKEETMEEPAVEETKEEPKEEPTVEEPKEDKTVELEKRISDLETKLADLETKLAEIATAPAAAPVVDEFENIKKIGKTGDKSLDKRIAIAAALKN